MATTVFAHGSALKRLTVETEMDAEALGALKNDATYRLDIVLPKDKRSYEQLKLLFAMIKLIRDNTPVEPPLTKTGVLNVLKLQTGHVEMTKLPSGAIHLAPSSIAFENMKQADFNPWFEKALGVMCRDFLPGLSVEAARREIEALAFGHGQRRAA